MKKSIVLIPLPSLIKNSFVRSFSLSIKSMSRCEVDCQKVSPVTAARPGSVTSNEVNGSLLPTSFSGMQD